MQYNTILCVYNTATEKKDRVSALFELRKKVSHPHGQATVSNVIILETKWMNVLWRDLFLDYAC